MHYKAAYTQCLKSAFPFHKVHYGCFVWSVLGFAVGFSLDFYAMPFGHGDKMRYE